MNHNKTTSRVRTRLLLYSRASSSDGDEFLARAALHEVLDVRPGPKVAGDDVVQSRVEDQVVLVRLHGHLDGLVDVKVADFLVQEHRHRLLVRRAEHARHGPARPTRGVAHREAGVLLDVRLAERQVAHLDEVQARPRHLAALHALRPGHGVQDGQAHVRPSELREHGRVRGFHHAVDDALRVNHHVDVIVRSAVQVVRLDHLQRLVHEGRRVARDLRAHVPVRVRRGLLLQKRGVLLGTAEHLLVRDVAERAAGGGEDDSAKRVLGQALDALENSGVLRVRGEDLHSVLHGEGHDGGPARDERLFVGEADVLARLDGGDGGGQARASDNAGDRGVHVLVPRHLDHALLAVQKLGRGTVHVLDHLAKLLEIRAVADGDHLGLELLDLLREHVQVLARAQRHDLELVGVLLRDVQRLRADGAGGAQQRDLLDVAVAERGDVAGDLRAAGPARAVAGLVVGVGAGGSLDGHGALRRLGR
mmetsp:Transcript_1180/g.4669  ORF Transcript_1180/g.4669 Transcript_1180/m.4669 type:complete len:477 (-) Transcript_1180:87-1517(-)